MVAPKDTGPSVAAIDGCADGSFGGEMDGTPDSNEV